MTNSSDSRDPRQRRSRREPPTIDLKATELKASARAASQGEDAVKSDPKAKPGSSGVPATGAAATTSSWAPPEGAASKGATPEVLTPASGGAPSKTADTAREPAGGAVPASRAGGGAPSEEEVAPVAEVGTIVDPAVGTDEGAARGLERNKPDETSASEGSATDPGAAVAPAGAMDPSAVVDSTRDTLSGSSSDEAAPIASATGDTPAATTLAGGDDPLAGGERGADEPAPMGAHRSSPERRGGAGASLGAGLLGGLLGAAAAAAILIWWQPNRTQTLEPRLAALEARLDALPRSEATSGNLQERLQAATQERTALADRLRQLEERAQSGAASAGTGGQAAPPELNELTARLAAIEEQLRGQPQNAADSGVAAFDQRLSEQSQGLTARIEEQAQRIGSLEGQLGERAQAFTSGLQSLEQRLAEQGRAVEGLRGEIQQVQGRIQGQVQANSGAVQALDRRAAEQDQRLADIARRIDEQGARTQAASLRVIAADRIDRALREGTPYEPSLQALRSFKVEPERIAALEPFASGGAPSGEELAGRFEPVGREILRQSRSGSEDWGDRLLRMADRVVTVRPVDQAGGDSLPALVARIERALERDAFGDALKAWQALPEQARQTSAEFGRTLADRVAAGEAARRIAGDALAALDRPAQ